MLTFPFANNLVEDLHPTVIPARHAEAIASRPLARHGIARQTRHANQTTVLASKHSMASVIQEALTKVSGFSRASGRPRDSYSTSTLAFDPQRRLQSLPRWQDYWEHCSNSHGATS